MDHYSNSSVTPKRGRPFTKNHPEHDNPFEDLEDVQQRSRFALAGRQMRTLPSMPPPIRICTPRQSSRPPPVQYAPNLSPRASRKKAQLTGLPLPANTSLPMSQLGPCVERWISSCDGLLALPLEANVDTDAAIIPEVGLMSSPEIRRWTDISGSAVDVAGDQETSAKDGGATNSSTLSRLH